MVYRGIAGCVVHSRSVTANNQDGTGADDSDQACCDGWGLVGEN